MQPTGGAARATPTETAEATGWNTVTGGSHQLNAAPICSSATCRAGEQDRLRRRRRARSPMPRWPSARAAARRRAARRGLAARGAGAAGDARRHRLAGRLPRRASTPASFRSPVNTLLTARTTPTCSRQPRPGGAGLGGAAAACCERRRASAAHGRAHDRRLRRRAAGARPTGCTSWTTCSPARSR